MVLELATPLSWSHFVELLGVKSEAVTLYYAKEVVDRNLGTKELRHQISRKAYELRQIANSHLTEKSALSFNVFKDPYLFDVLGLKENFLEADLEKAVISELEAFILEVGHGFTFVERRKRMIIDGADIVLDLLFFHLKKILNPKLKRS
jgi:predicted nuclease of restriction endonuclease-like (RecB) superfamily